MWLWNQQQRPFSPLQKKNWCSFSQLIKYVMNFRSGIIHFFIMASFEAPSRLNSQYFIGIFEANRAVFILALWNNQWLPVFCYNFRWIKFHMWICTLLYITITYKYRVNTNLWRITTANLTVVWLLTKKNQSFFFKQKAGKKFFFIKSRFFCSRGCICYEW